MRDGLPMTRLSQSKLGGMLNTAPRLTASMPRDSKPSQPILRRGWGSGPLEQVVRKPSIGRLPSSFLPLLPCGPRALPVPTASDPTLSCLGLQDGRPADLICPAASEHSEQTAGLQGPSPGQPLTGPICIQPSVLVSRLLLRTPDCPSLVFTAVANKVSWLVVGSSPEFAIKTHLAGRSMCL